MERMIAATAPPVATSRRAGKTKQQRANAATTASNGGAAAAIDAAAAGASTPAVAVAASHGRKSLSVEEQQRLADEAHLLGTSVAAIAKRTRRGSKPSADPSRAGDDGGGDGDSASAAAVDVDVPFAFLAATKPMLLPDQELPIPKQRSSRATSHAAAAEGSNGSAGEAAGPAAATLSSALSALLPSTHDDNDDDSSSAGEPASAKNGTRATRKRKPSAKALAAAAQAMKGAQDIRAMFGKQSPPANAAAAAAPATVAAATPAAALRNKLASSAADSDDFMETAAAAASHTPPRSRSKLRGSTAGATPKRHSARHTTPIVIDGDDASEAASSSAPPPPSASAGALVRSSSVASLAHPASLSSTPPSAARPVVALVPDGAVPAAATVSGRKDKGGRKRSRAAAAADDAESVASDLTGSAAPILPALSDSAASAAAAAAPFVAPSATGFRSRSKAGASAAELHSTPPSSTPSAASAATSSGSMSSLALSMGSQSTDASAMFLAVPSAVALPPDTLAASVRHSTRARKPAAVLASEDNVALTPSKRRKRAVSPALATESPVAIAAVSARKLRSPIRSKVTAERKEPASPTASEATATSSSGKGVKSKALRNVKCCRPRGLQKQLHCVRCGVGHTIACTGLSEREVAGQRSWTCRGCSESGEVRASPAPAPGAPVATPATATAASSRRSSPALFVGSSISPVSLTPAASSSPVIVLRRPLMPLPLPIPSPSMEEEQEEQDSAAAAASFVAPLVVAPQPRRAPWLQRTVSEQFESAPTPRIAARAFEDMVPSSSSAVAAAARRRQQQPENVEMKSLGDAAAHAPAVLPTAEVGSAAMPMELDDVSEEEQGPGPAGREGEGEEERDEEEEAIASISTPAPLSPLSSASAHDARGGQQQQLQHRTLSTAITPPLSPIGGEDFPLSQEDECETGQDDLGAHEPDLSMDSPDLSQYDLTLTPPSVPASREAVTGPSPATAAAAAAAPSPLQPSRAVSNVSHSSTLTRLSVQLNGEPHAAAALSSTAAAAAAVAPPSKLGRASRSPQTLRRADATSSNHSLPHPLHPRAPSPVRRPTRALAAAAAASAAGSAASKSSKPPHYTMSDLQSTSWHLPPTPAFPFDVHAAAATCQGWFRGKNQDTFICEAVRVPASIGGTGQPPPPLLILGVADGHGILGHLASAVCSARMPLLLKDCVLLQGQPLEDAVTHAIAVCHAEINERAEQIRGVQPPTTGQADDDQDSSVAASSAPPRRNGHGQQSPSRTPMGGGAAAAAVLRNADFGTTIVMCVMQGTKGCVAHVGDSRCIILQRDTHTGSAAADAQHSSGSGSPESPSASPFRVSSAPWVHSFVTSDHNGEHPAERARVRSAGGSLLDVKDPNGDHREYRVFPAKITLAEAREMSLTINMTRALGHIKLGQRRGGMRRAAGER